MWGRPLLLMFGSRYGPMTWSAIIPAHTLILNLCWWLWTTCAHGFSSARTCILFRFNIPLRVNVHSSVNVAAVCIVVNITPQNVLVVGSPPPVMRGLFADGMDGVLVMNNLPHGILRCVQRLWHFPSAGGWVLFDQSQHILLKLRC